MRPPLYFSSAFNVSIMLNGRHPIPAYIRYNILLYVYRVMGIIYILCIIRIYRGNITHVSVENVFHSFSAYVRELESTRITHIILYDNMEYTS